MHGISAIVYRECLVWGKARTLVIPRTDTSRPIARRGSVRPTGTTLVHGIDLSSAHSFWELRNS